ncbi:unnamed protein product, partial [Polarella glacialis]
AKNTIELERLYFAKRIVRQLRQSSGIYGIRTLRLMLHSMDYNGDGMISSHALNGALTQMGIRLTEEQCRAMTSCLGTGEDDRVDYVILLSNCYRNWTKKREEVVAEIFDILSAKCEGRMLTVNALMAHFKPQALTPDLLPELEGDQSHSQSSAAFLKQWVDSIGGTDGVVTWLEFACHYLDLSVCFQTDAQFVTFVCHSWGKDADEWLAKQVFCHFAQPDSSDMLEIEDFREMLSSFGFDITKDEADVWFETLDEDRQGRVTLEQFISSKVLKARKMWDEFVTNEHHSASKQDMVNILQ